MEEEKNKIKERQLIRRYLIWCYKTTREALERIDRKFTQLTVDRHIMGLLPQKAGGAYQEKLDEFQKYINEKEKAALEAKYADPGKTILNGEYVYLRNRLTAVEKTICDLLGKEGLEEIQLSYEEEMTKRILAARDHE